MDDLNILCRNMEMVKRALAQMHVYEAAAGAKLNVSKSACLSMGKVRDLESLGVSVPREGVRILGIDFDPELSGRTAWEKTEAKMGKGRPEDPVQGQERQGQGHSHARHPPVPVGQVCKHDLQDGDGCKSQNRMPCS
ncbi:hypothetical protein Y1Q_0006324 [Alligator mississippiensis]|uniref:Reverse transcriptase domain-containing protein n=1 Tax=Alligator mississippiensis TaxID=8496 RepID=A0A151NXD2_ALLMI|nr:hypothetical protein Y1Q_0006324 [Alligator mississippiensis]